MLIGLVDSVFGGTTSQDSAPIVTSETSRKEVGAPTSNVESDSVRCLDLPNSVMADIASGEQDGVGMTPVRGAYFKSPDFVNVYFMAIRFGAAGIDEQVGVWARNGVDSGVILSVDGFAKSFTVWPDASKTDAQISGADRNIDIVKRCLAN